MTSSTCIAILIIVAGMIPSKAQNRGNGDMIGHVSRTYLGSTVFINSEQFVVKVLTDVGVASLIPSSLDTWLDVDTMSRTFCWQRQVDVNDVTKNVHIGDIIVTKANVGVVVGLNPRYVELVVGQTVKNSILSADDNGELVVWRYTCQLNTN